MCLGKVKVSTLVSICSPRPISAMHGHILMKHLHYLLPGTHNIDNIFKVMGSEVKVTGNIFKNALFLQKDAHRQFALKDCLVCILATSVLIKCLSSSYIILFSSVICLQFVMHQLISVWCTESVL